MMAGFTINNSFKRRKMMKIFIELDFEETPSQADVENYLNELMSNNCLDWYTDTEENEEVEG
jgi:hypothetical protein